MLLMGMFILWFIRMSHSGPTEDQLLRRIRDTAAHLQSQTEGFFRAPYRLEHRVIPSAADEAHPRVTVVFLLSKKN